MMATPQKAAYKKQWTAEEDTLLLELVQVNGVAGSWPKIADLMGTRSGKQCRERYVNQLDPFIKKSVWTHEEDVVIKKIHSQVGKKWCRFMDQLPGRSDNAIKNRYHIISKNNYAEHNRVALRKAIEAARVGSTVSAANVSTVFAPESNQEKLERFRAARILLDEKIMNLLLEQKVTEDLDPCAVYKKRENSLAEKESQPYSNGTTDMFDFDIFSDLGNCWEHTETDLTSTYTCSASAPATVSAPFDNGTRVPASAAVVAVAALPDSALPRHAFLGQKGYANYLGFSAGPACTAQI